MLHEMRASAEKSSDGLDKRDFQGHFLHPEGAGRPRKIGSKQSEEPR